jgi:4-hydroxy-4-methyl-2-oxoglutarate aldolase
MSLELSNIGVRDVACADPSVIVVQAQCSVATMDEAMSRLEWTKPYMRPIWPGAQITGSAITVLLQPGDIWTLHAAVAQCRPGDALIVACAAHNTDGMFGDLLPAFANVGGAIGLVIDAGYCGLRPHHDRGFPAGSRAVSAKGMVGATLGAVNLLDGLARSLPPQ